MFGLKNSRRKSIIVERERFFFFDALVTNSGVLFAQLTSNLPTLHRKEKKTRIIQNQNVIQFNL